MKSRLFVRRESGYLSPYSLGDFYVASVTRPKQFGTFEKVTPVVLIHGKYREVPRWVMHVFRPFNRYRDSRGRRVSTFS